MATVYCEYCGRRINGIRSIDRFLGAARNRGQQIECRDCHGGDAVYDPRTGQVRTWRGLDGVDYPVNAPADAIPWRALMTLRGGDG